MLAVIDLLRKAPGDTPANMHLIGGLVSFLVGTPIAGATRRGMKSTCLIEPGGNAPVPVETKSGQTFHPDFVKELHWW